MIKTKCLCIGKNIVIQFFFNLNLFPFFPFFCLKGFVELLFCKVPNAFTLRSQIVVLEEKIDMM